MSYRLAISTGLVGATFIALSLAGCADRSESAASDSTGNPQISPYGVVTQMSKHPFGETVALLKADIAAKQLMFFDEFDQQKLGGDAGIATRPSTLLVFGNPALGVQFVTANPQAGIDWPVRMLVYQDQAGQVWVEYTDFAYIASRHAIADRDPQFQKAGEVIGSIASSVTQ
jgi:uncharacterized protein (DUF302 family)